jgi:FdhE protein
MAQVVADLEHLARVDAAVAPLARLQAVALETADDPAWTAAVQNLTRPPGSAPDDGIPLLHGLTLTVDADRQRALLRRLAATLAASGSAEAGSIEALFASNSFDPLALLLASLTQNAEALEAEAAGARIDGAVLAVVAHTATLPLLLAYGRHAADAIEAMAWAHGYCPVCAAWPTLAEIRGLARDFVLRCGRCASGWRVVQAGCVFCGGQEQESRGYFAAEQERESRRAAVCDGCHGYLKTIATLGPLSASDLLLRDLQSLELDVTALEHGYGRPDGLGWDLVVQIEPTVGRSERHDGVDAAGASQGDSGWRRFWR